MKNKKNNSTTIWNKYYQDFEKGDWLGNQYPNEFLIRFVSNLRKKYILPKITLKTQVKK